MDFYSGKQPNLIGPIMKSTMCKVIKKPTINNTVSDKVSSYVSDLYKDYIIDNKIAIFILLIFVAFLVYRYYNKNETKKIKPKESFTNEDANLINEIKFYQTKHLQHDNPPKMNPTEPPSEQENDVFYPPDPLPINIPGNGLVFSRDIYNNTNKFPQFNNTPYDHNNVYNYPTNTYFEGTYNTYQNAQDTNIMNPYNWSNSFNTNSGAFVSPMTNLNMQNMVDYQTILDNTNNNLTNALKLGPKFIDTNKPEYDMEPPYAQDF
ncbi:hypothetical protein QKU48_gp0376 [Fadolivirus algeromassiliense]|jgi:hypothetical protein|uniref:Uncharacterized protein n=1 Tax=Fadolivirus FV1/VV64 TaxID=3070911 RepID=A0A7D3UVA3_9VIRU|nr:hypothetical protein QKU48_gp0376 [Fadolivirus algeromassiliense]QKF93834.1 hypothetical protein Fadolivirus_1_376 [Fadolivirus FV1/VV64]